MRIMLLAPPAAGGIRNHLLDLIEHFSKRYELFLASPPDPVLVEGMGKAGGTFLPLKTWRGQYPGPQGVMQMRSFLQIHKPAFLHLHGYKAGLVGRLAAFHTGIPIINTLHNYLACSGKVSMFQGPFYVLERKLPSPVEKYIAVSAALKEDFVHRSKLAANKVVVIHNGIKTQPFETATPVSGLRKKGSPIIGTVLRLAWQKGADVLLEAVPLLRHHYPQGTLLIVGEGPLGQTLASQAKELGCGDYVRFLGHYGDLPGFFKSLDIFVLPSRTEGLGMVLLEALACKVPVVATSVGGIPEVITSGTHGLLVPPQNPAALAGGILQLLNNRERRCSLAEKGFQRIKEEYLLKDMLIKTEEIYQEVSQKGRG